MEPHQHVEAKRALISATTGCAAAIAMLMVLAAPSVRALSLISERCDASKVGPDEVTVKGGWQAEMFNGLAFRACEKGCMPDASRAAIVQCFKQHSPRAYTFYNQCTKNATLVCTEQNKHDVHLCMAQLSQGFVHQEKCGEILSEPAVKCLTPHLTDQIELCFIKSNLNRSPATFATTPAPPAGGPAAAGAGSQPATSAGSSPLPAAAIAQQAAHAHQPTATGGAAGVALSGAASGKQPEAVAVANAAPNMELIVQSPRPARAFLKQFEYANYDAHYHACDPELEFNQQITSHEVTEIQAFYTIASTLCRDECLPAASKQLMHECLMKNSPQGAKVYAQCTSQHGQYCSAANDESLTSCFHNNAQNLTMSEKCVELVSDATQKCWSQLIQGDTTYCVERKNLQTISFEYGRVCNAAPAFAKRPKEEQTQITTAHKTNQENLLRRALEVMCFPNCVDADRRAKMVKCMTGESPYALDIYQTCSKQSKIRCDLEENIEVYAEYINCIYTEADALARNSTSSALAGKPAAGVSTTGAAKPAAPGTCVNLVNPGTFSCWEGLYPSEIFHCPDVKVFHEAQAEAISHAEHAHVEEYDYENN